MAAELGRETLVYLTGVCSPAVLEHAGRGDLGLLVQPATTSYAKHTVAFAAGFGLDNGCFSMRDFDEERWCSWLSTMPREGCRFAAAPDVVADAEATWRRSEPWMEVIRGLGFPAALVFQDGIEETPIPWSAFDAAFIGGSTEWKLSPVAASLIAEARERGKWVHVGRVNSRRRLRAVAAIGADSVDGTYLAFAPRSNLARLLGWLDELADDRPAR